MQFNKNQNLLSVNRRRKSSMVFVIFNIIAIVTLIGLIKFVFTPSIGQAATGINKALNFRGTLKDSGGTNVTDGSYSIVFRIYDSASGGTCLYTAGGSCGSPTGKSISVTSGVFSTLIGDTDNGDNLLSLDFNSDTYWLGVKVDSDDELTPRVRIGASGYAFNADLLDGLNTSSNGGTTSFIPSTNNFGNLTMTGESRGTEVSNSIFYLNTSTATSTNSLLGLAVGDDEKFRIDAAGNVYASGTIYSAGSGTSTIQGGIDLQGDVILGNSNFDNIEFSGRVSSSILPSVNNVFDIGAYANAWNNIYASGTAYISTDVIVNGQSVCLADGTNCLGGGGSSVDWTNNGTEVRLATSTQNVTIGASGSLAKLTVLGDTDEKQLVIKNNATQNANPFELQNSSGAPIAWINPTGNFGVSGTIYGSIATSTWYGNVSTSTLDGMVIGGSTAAAGTFTNLTANTSVSFPSNSITDAMVVDTITASNYIEKSTSTLDGMVIGESTAAAGTFTNLASTGNTDLGNDTSDTITATGRFDSNLTPSANNTYDLGIYGNAWRNIYASSSIKLETQDLTKTNTTLLSIFGPTRWYDDGEDYVMGTTSTLQKWSSDVWNGTTTSSLVIGEVDSGGKFYINSLYNTGNATFDGSSVTINDATPTYVNGTLWVGNSSSDIIIVSSRFNSSLTPFANNLSYADLGSPTLSWNEVYASGTIYAGTDVVVNGQSVCLADNTNCPNGSGVDWTNSGTEISLATSTQNVTIGASGNLAKLTVLGDTDEKQFVIKNNATQNANPFELQNSSGAPIAWINPTGNFGVSGTIYGSIATTTWYGNVSTSTLDGVVVGGSTAAAGTFTNLTANTSVSLPNNSITDAMVVDTITASNYIEKSTSTLDGMVIGGSTAAAGTFTNLTSTGNTDLGDDENDTITAVGRFDSNLTPSTNNERDLGAYDNAWRNIYASGTLNVAGTATFTSPILAYDAVTFYNATYFNQGADITGGSVSITAGGVSVGSGGTTSTFKSILPQANNSFDLGYDNLAWNNIYASGTAYIGTDVVVAGQSVCLADGTNCQTGGSSVDWSNSATEVYLATSTQNVTIGASGSLAKLTVLGDADEKQFVIKNNATQNANPFELQNSSGAPIAWINPTGNFGVSGTIYGSIATTTWYGNVSTSTLDGVVVGGSTPAAGTFTSLTANTSVSFPSNSITDVMVSDTLTASNLVAGSSVVSDSEVDNDITISGGTIGSNSISGTLTTTASLTIGDNGDAIIIDASNWDVSSAGIITPHGIATSTWDGVVIGGSTAAAGTFTNLSVTNEVAGNFIPGSNNTYNLGSAVSSWKDIYASGTITANIIKSTNPAAVNTIEGSFYVNGSTINIGDSSSDHIDVSAQFTSSLIPATNNLYALGTGALSWYDVYASGTIYVGTDIKVAGKSVCLADGTNCSGGGGGGGDQWVLSGTAVNLTTSTNEVVIGGTGALAKLTVLGDTDEKQFVIKNNATQNANPFELQNNSGAPIAWINPTGGFGASNTSYFNSIFANANNTYDLGGYGNAWKDIYASGTLRVGSTAFLNSNSLYFSTSGTFESAGTSTFISGLTDNNTGSSAFVFNTSNVLSNSKILSIQENGSEVSYFDTDGGLFTPSSTISGTFTGSGAINLGDNGDSVTVNSNTWDISSAGVTSNLSITTSTLDNVVIGGSTPAAGTFTSLTANTSVSLPNNSIIDAMVVDTITASNYIEKSTSTLDGVVVGGSTAVAGTFTSLTANTSVDFPDDSITDVMVSDTLTASNLVAGSSVVSDSEVDNDITISGGTIGSNSISGTLTTTASLTIGDNGDAIIIDASNWDVSSAGIITPHGIATSTWDGVTIGANTRGAGNFTNLDFNGVGTLGDGGDGITIDSNTWDISSAGTATGLSITTSTLDNIIIGGSTPSAGYFTNASSTQFSIFDQLYIGGTATSTFITGARGSATSTLYSDLSIINRDLIVGGAVGSGWGWFGNGTATTSIRGGLAGQATSTFAGDVSIENLYSGIIDLGTDGGIVSALTNRVNNAASGTYQGYTFDVDGLAVLKLQARSDGQAFIWDKEAQFDGRIGSAENNVYDIGQATSSFKDIYASGTIYAGTDVVVAGQSVCLADGTNCQTGGASVDWSNSATEVYLATSTQNVTIGASGSLAKLTVLGDADEKQFVIKNNATQNANPFELQNSSGAPIAWINPTGNFGVSGTIYSTGSGTSTISSGINLATNGGNVGIGTSTPAYPLEVAGSILAAKNGENAQLILGWDGSTTNNSICFNGISCSRYIGLSSSGVMNFVDSSGLYFANGATFAGSTNGFSGSISVNGDTILGNAITDLVTLTGRTSSTIFSAYDNIYVGRSATTTIAGGLAGQATSTFAGDVSIDNLYVGGIEFAPDNGLTEFVNAPVSANATTGTLQGGALLGDGLPSAIWGCIADAQGLCYNRGFGVNTSTLYYGYALNVNGDIFIDGTGSSTFRGNIDTEGNIKLGNTSTDNVEFAGRVSSNLVPSANNTYDLGIYGNAWRNIYASGTLNVAGTATFTSPILAYDAVAFYNAVYFNEDVIVLSGSVNITTGGVSVGSGGTTSTFKSILPQANNSFDLGYHNISWQDIYASGTIYAGTDIQVAGTSVCLADGTNCQTGGGDTDWTNNATEIRLATSTQNVTIGASGNLAKLTVLGDTDEKQFVIKNNATQNANPFELQNNSNAPIAWINPTGNFGVSGTIYSTGSGTSTFVAGIEANNLSLGNFASYGTQAPISISHTVVNSDTNETEFNGIKNLFNINAVSSGSDVYGIHTEIASGSDETLNNLYASYNLVTKQSNTTISNLAANQNNIVIASATGGNAIGSNSLITLSSGATAGTLTGTGGSVISSPGTVSVARGAAFSASGATTNYGVYAGATGGTTAYGIYAEASGATNNYAGYFNGKVHIVGDNVSLKVPNGWICVDNDGDCDPAGGGVDGTIYADAFDSTTAKDLAERFPTTSTSIEAGDVVGIDFENSENIVKTTSTYSNNLLGVISTKAGFILGGENEENAKPVALSGRVPVKVSNENGVIKIGDYLTSASLAGYAMKMTSPGVTIGRALSGFDGQSETGTVIVFVNTGWYNGDGTSSSFGLDSQLLTVSNNENNIGAITVIDNSFDLEGNSIINISSIENVDHKWQIDEVGNFVTKGEIIKIVETTQGEKELYPVYNPDPTLMFSGSGSLVNGEARIIFDPIISEMFDPLVPINVSVTMTSEGAQGLYVAEKSIGDILVKELNAGRGSAFFDYIIIGRRKMDGNLSNTSNTSAITNIENITSTEVSGNIEEVFEEINNTTSTPETSSSTDETASSTPETSPSTNETASSTPDGLSDEVLVDFEVNSSSTESGESEEYIVLIEEEDFATSTIEEMVDTRD